MAGVGGPDERYRAALALARVCHSGGNAILRLLKTMSPEEIWTAAPRAADGRGYGRSGRATVRKVEVRAGRPRGREWSEGGRVAFRGARDGRLPRRTDEPLPPPAGLFVQGDEEKLEGLLTLPRITIVGTRRASAYGTRAARDFAAAFAARGIAVVSGMALGVDGRSHEAALDVRGLTVAVLGCGADIVYPPRHRGLYQLIADKGVSRSANFRQVFRRPRGRFPHRNRLLAALGDAVIVIEGSRTSGAMQTADQAAGLGPAGVRGTGIHLRRRITVAAIF